MNTALKVLLTIFLVLLLAFFTIAIVGAFNLDPGEEIVAGRLAAVIVGELIAIVGLYSLWRRRDPAGSGPAATSALPGADPTPPPPNDSTNP
jgi:hypothetical protein